MGRRGGGGRRSGGGGGMFGGRKAAAPAKARAPARKRAPPPAKAASAPPPAAAAPAAGGGMMSGLASTVMQGMAFGTGSAVAHRAVDSVMGPRGGNETSSNDAPAAVKGGPCGDEFTQFNQCVNDSQGNVASCRFFYDVLSQCQDNSSDSSQKWN